MSASLHTGNDATQFVCDPAGPPCTCNGGDDPYSCACNATLDVDGVVCMGCWRPLIEIDTDTGERIGAAPAKGHAHAL